MLALQIHQQVDHLRLDRDIEGADGFVGHDQARVERQGAGDGNALALAAAELVREVVHLRRAQADLREDLGGAGIGLGTAGNAVDQQGLADDGARRHARVERAERVLEDHLHLAAEGAHLRLGELRYVRAAEADGAGGGFHQAHHGARHGGLAAAGFADEAEGLAFVDAEADAIDGMHLADGAAQQALLDGEVLLEVLDLDHGRGHSVPP